MHRLAQPLPSAGDGQHAEAADQAGKARDVAVPPLGVDQGRAKDGPPDPARLAEGRDRRLALRQPLRHGALARIGRGGLGHPAGGGEGDQPTQALVVQGLQGGGQQPDRRQAQHPLRRGQALQETGRRQVSLHPRPAVRGRRAAEGDERHAPLRRHRREEAADQAGRAQHQNRRLADLVRHLASPQPAPWRPSLRPPILLP